MGGQSYLARFMSITSSNVDMDVDVHRRALAQIRYLQMGVSKFQNPPKTLQLPSHLIAFTTILLLFTPLSSSPPPPPPLNTA